MQVSTCKQLATGFVCAFPWLFRMSSLITALVVREGLPSREELLSDTSVSDLQHAANWATTVPCYLEEITEHNLDIHVPFSKPEPQILLT